MYVEHLHLRRSFAFFRSVGSHEPHDLHVHDCLEVGVLLKNTLMYRFGDKTYRGEPGDVFLCRPFEPHWSYAEPNRPFESIILLFTPGIARKFPDGSRLLAPFYTNKGVLPVIRAETSHAKAIKHAACQAMTAQEEEEPAWQTRQYKCLIDILLHVHEWAAESQGTESVVLAEIAEAVGLMLEDFRRPQDIDGLAKRAGMGRTLFFEEFRVLTGLTPSVFLTRLRLQYAMDLLRTTNETVLEIAGESGFQSLSTFNKQFKRYTGDSPRTYRQQQKAGPSRD
ncbi:MAG TPA: AraC family transcriptional regulator [Bacillales bacterium]|nr:AraC family transcriptional regulator [Bacillales bacterium]